jgi:ankyrin repeat protein
VDKTVQQELFAVIGSGNLFLLEEAIRGGADVNVRAGDPNGDTPLLRAIAGGDVEMVRLLLGAGANPNAAGLLAGFTPVMIALGKPAILRELIAAGADVNARTDRRKGMKTVRGGTALHLAAAANNIEATRVLIEAGAEVEARDENGLAPLDLALKLGLPTETSITLVEAGAALTSERQRAMHSTASEPESYLTGESEISKKVEEILRSGPRAMEFQDRKWPSPKYHLGISLLVLGSIYIVLTRHDMAALPMTSMSFKDFAIVASVWFVFVGLTFYKK